MKISKLRENSSAGPVLKPDLDDPHVQPGVGGQLFPHVSGGLGAGLVSSFQNLHLAGSYGGARSLVSVHTVAVICR